MKKMIEPAPPKSKTDRRGVLDFQSKEGMLAVLCRHQEAHEAVSGVLTHKHVRSISDGHAVVWKAVCRFYEQYSELPAIGQLQDAMSALLAEDPTLVNDDEADEVDRFVEYVFDDEAHGRDISKSKSHLKSALGTCKAFVEDLSAQTISEIMIRDGSVPVDLPEALREAGELVQLVSGLDAPAIGEFMPEGWDEEAYSPLRPTNMSVFDTFLAGGLEGGEVMVYMGPYGSCKSTIGMQMAVNFAESAATAYALAGSKGPRDVSIFVSTEMGSREARHRALSYAAQIPRKTLRKMKTLADLCGDDKPGTTPATKYEKKAFRDEYEAGVFRNERQRARAAIDFLNRHLLFIECTSNNQAAPLAGQGGVREIASMIAAEVRRQKKKIRPCFFCLDHASALANSMMEVSQGYKSQEDGLRLVLKNIPRLVGDLAKKYDMPALVLHQLSGAANDKVSAAEGKSTDAAECKSFAEFPDHVFVGSRPTEDGRRLARIDFTKHRREPPKKFAVIQVQGNFSRIKDASAEFVIEQRQFISKKDADSLASSNKKKAKKVADDAFGSAD